MSIEEEQSEFLEKALEEATLPDWALLAAMGPSTLSEKGKLMVRLNMRQHGIQPRRNNYSRKGNR